jgi:hypothetical protein
VVGKMTRHQESFLKKVCIRLIAILKQSKYFTNDDLHEDQPFVESDEESEKQNTSVSVLDPSKQMKTNQSQFLRRNKRVLSIFLLAFLDFISEFYNLALVRLNFMAKVNETHTLLTPVTTEPKRQTIRI